MAKKLWGTRFPKKTSMLADKFTSSISFDQRLAAYDILGSIAHAKMLGKQKIIPLRDINEFEADVDRLVQQIAPDLAGIEAGKEKGYVSTLLGRRRYLADLKSRNTNLKKAANGLMKLAAVDYCISIIGQGNPGVNGFLLFETN